MSDLQTDLAADGVYLSTKAAGLAFDWLLRAQRAVALNHAGELWPAWSSGEILAVALILDDDARIEDLAGDRDRALDVLRYDLGNHEDIFNLRPLSLEDAAKVFARLSEAVR